MRNHHRKENQPPPVHISSNNRMKMTLTNLYPEYATRSSNCALLLMLSHRYMDALSSKISAPTAIKAFVAIEPNNSGWKALFKPAIRADNRIYVTRAISGIYM